jgi:excisionase family DNA binding protein
MALKDKYMTVAEAAREYKVTRQTISRWINEGRVEVEKVGREKLINKRSFEKYLKKKVEKILGKFPFGNF